MRDGYIIHEHVVWDEIEKDVMVNTLLIDMYDKCGALEEAPSTFEDMCEMTIVSWNTLSEAYSSKKQGEEEEALHLFIELQHGGVMPDEVTFILFKKENTKPHVVNFLGDLTVCTNLTSLDGCFSFSDDLETLEKVVKLLAYISHRDLFAEFFRKKLDRRLLFDKSANDDHEAKLKEQCGGHFTSKIGGYGD